MLSAGDTRLLAPASPAGTTWDEAPGEVLTQEAVQHSYMLAAVACTNAAAPAACQRIAVVHAEHVVSACPNSPATPPQVDQAATPAGEKLRRRHDAHGKMCYWLQAPADVQHGGSMIVEGLSACR